MASPEQPLTLGLFLKKLVFNGQPYLVYPAGFLPRPRCVRRPSAYGLPYRDIEIRTSDNVLLRCFLIEHQRPKATVLMFHGNGMDHSDLLYHARHYYQFRLNVLTVSYRGYGESEGVPSEKGLQRDAQAALDYVLRDSQLSKLPIILYGLSLGGAVAIDVTSTNPHKITALIIENTFTSIPDIVRGWPIIGPLSFACTQRWNSASKLSKIPPSVPILFCSGRNDSVVPPAHMDNLWRIAQARGRGVNRSGGVVGCGGCGGLGGGKMVGLGGLLCAGGSGTLRKGGEVGEEGRDVWVPPEGDLFTSYPGGGHVDTCTRPTYWSEIDRFINKCVSLRT